jgi:hypothetical protein
LRFETLEENTNTLCGVGCEGVGRTLGNEGCSERNYEVKEGKETIIKEEDKEELGEDEEEGAEINGRG